ncbi:MBL fold metallo-hydrolase [Altererythrobacter sp. TH136]|uniref:MBL fold metallo-hydrolase n=1 Tax=Altererythrobacter sp. TH136 TaxID=2067415 RepID=UPI0011653389|nr:MBL fold metallo-hydrolase [Altererythrobacter sp. TH136]QDM40381.1 MBL fold metallo-hydrolase [Altererythrobacter sp. TH136]
MILEKIKTPGLSHLSYLVGSGGKAAVIDPRRDCEIYVEKARAEGLEITHILETHRNEDFVSGAPVLAEMTGATVFHGPNADGEVVYAQTTREGDRHKIGSLEIAVLETPGHTFDHVAYALFDSDYPEGAVGVFTGDALFIGDVGRTDFYPDRKREVSGLLFDSLRKICGVGDQAIVYPAHGAGSVCGSGMADREFSTIGHERRNNSLLQIEDRAAFIDRKVNENHYQPPYFRLMERLNLVGGEPAPRTARPAPLSLDQLASCGADHLVDVREPLAYASGHLPGSINLPVDMVPAFAGWFIREGETVALIGSAHDQLEEAMEHLVRIALDNVLGGYVGVVPAAAEGTPMRLIPMIDTETVERRLAGDRADWTLLDVRDADERAEESIEGSHHIYVGELNDRWRELDPSRRYTLMCASGMRATIAAGWLESKGVAKVDVYLGSMGAWKAAQEEDRSVEKA